MSVSVCVCAKGDVNGGDSTVRFGSYRRLLVLGVLGVFAGQLIG